MVGPVVGERDQGERSRSFASAEQLDFIAEFGVIHFAQRGGAKFEARLQAVTSLSLPSDSFSGTGALTSGKSPIFEQR